MSEAVWLCIGFAGQALFTARFIVQWLASEREGRSVIPVSFWLLSIGGSLTLLAYAIYRLDPVFIVAQMTGSFIYLRNLALLRRERLGLPPGRRLGWGTLVRLLAAAPLLLALLAQAGALCYSLWIPSDPLPANLGNGPGNVAALPAKAPGDPVRFAVVGDIQRFGIFERLAEKLKQQPLDFLVLLGDLTHPPATAGSHRLAQLELAECEFPFPLFYLVGNHDVDEESFPLARWRKTYGPDQFWFKYGGHVFVFLHAASERHPYKTAADTFLRDALGSQTAKPDRIFVFNHVPLPVGHGWRGRALPEAGADRLEQLLREHRVDYCISGDYHGYATVRKGATQFIVSGGGGGHLKDPVTSFYHATVFSVLPDGVQTQLVVTTEGKELDDALERFILLKLLPQMSRRPGETALADALLLVLLFLLLAPLSRSMHDPATWQVARRGPSCGP